ncbi:MAG: DUF1295 domain-containing protein [Pseudomonadota bacterium]
MKYVSILFPFAIAAGVLLAGTSTGTAALINVLGQGLLFAIVVCLPLYKTGRMSYVDIGWPLGIVVIAVVAVFTLDGDATRRALIGGVYLLIGGRMALMALGHLRHGVLKEELPRYAYQRRRWEKSGKTNTMLAAQTEVIAQGAFNASFLAFPAFLIAANPAPTVSPLEVVGLVVWVVAYLFEEISDRQKRAFVRAQQAADNSNGVCDVGLWTYSRHPNYFGQWMGWNGVLIAALPSWLALYGSEHLVVWIGLGIGAAMVSYYMYNTLVYYSGALPSEYYSVRKRPAFADYQQRTNRFFPGPPRDSIATRETESPDAAE